jgi:DNA-binding winged helix-turn-helix (wHTH) protein
VTYLRFGAFCVDTEQRTLLRGSALVAIEPKVLACIELLASRAGALVTHAELQAALWPGVRVGPAALRRLIREARKALAVEGSDDSVIQTRPKLGYLLATTVTRDEGEQPARTLQNGWPFVGRGRQLESLKHALLEAERSGRGCLCWIAGEAGMGKSSLLSLLRARHMGRAVWLSGYCQSGPGVPAFWAWRAIVTAALAYARSHAPHAELAERDATWLLGADGACGLEARQRSAEDLFVLCGRVVAFLCALSEHVPLVVTLEDAHFADDGSLLLLELLARETERRSLVVLSSYRPEAVAVNDVLSRLLGRLSGRLGVRNVGLPALEVAELRELLVALARPVTVAAEVLAQLSGGNPLFTRHIIELSAHTQAGFEVAGLSLQQVVWERLRFLPARALELLGAAAVLGAEPALSSVAAVLRRSPAELQESLDQTVESGVLAPGSHGNLQFTHALLRDALYAALPLARRRELHVNAVRVWEEAPNGPSRSSALATHAFLAGPDMPRERTRAWCEQAGREALAHMAFDVAALQLGRALELVADSDTSDAPAELALSWARACFHADRPSEQITHAFFVAAERAQRSGNAHALASAAVGCALGDASHTQRIAAPWKRREIALLEVALEALLVSAAPAQQVELYDVAASLSAMCLSAGDEARARAVAQIALAHSPDHTDTWTGAGVCALRAEHAIVSFEPDHARAHLRELATHAANSELPARQRVELEIRVLGGALITGDLAAFRSARVALALATHELPELSHPSRWGERAAAYAGVVESTAFAELVITGELPAAERMLAELVPRAIAQALARTRHVEWTALLTMLPLFSYLGRAAQLGPAFDAHFAQYPAASWEVALARALLALEVGDLRAAQRNYAALRDTGFRLLHDGQLYAPPPPLRVLLAELCCALGTAEEAHVLYAQLVAWERLHAAIGVTISLGSYSRPLGELALASGEPERALRHLELAVAENLRFGHRPELARARLALSRALRRTGHHVEAETYAQQATHAAQAMGMRLPRA